QMDVHWKLKSPTCRHGTCASAVKSSAQNEAAVRNGPPKRAMRHTGSVSDTRIVCVPAILSVLSLTKEIWIFPILEILVFGRLFHWSNYQKTCQQNRKTH